MGMFDYVRLEDGLDVDLPGFDGDPTSVDWQTKTFQRPPMEVYKISMDGRLFKEEVYYETVPEEERPRYDEELGGFESEWLRMVGSERKVHEGWTDTEYHGILEFHNHVDGEGFAYEAKFTDGDLIEIRRVNRYRSD